MMNTTPPRWLRSMVTVLLAVSTASACAARHTARLDDTFIRGAEPGMDLGDGMRVNDPSTSPETASAAAMTIEETVGADDVPTVPLAGTVEDSDPLLMNAIVQAEVQPSAAHHRRVAELYQRHGILDLAYDHLIKAAELEPRDAATHDSLARLWRAWGLDRFGLGAAYRAVTYAPDSPQARNTLGTLLQAVGWRDDARRAYEDALALDGDAAYVLNNLCYLSFLEEDFEAAIEACKQAIERDPALIEAHNNLALVYFVMNEDELAQDALEGSGARSTALYNLGIAHLARGDHEEAAAVFTRASRARPGWAAPRERAQQARSSATRPGGQ